MLEHPLQRFFHSMRAKRPFDWVRFQRRDLLLIDHPLCQAVFSRQGAQLLHFQPQGERPLLWCASEWPALSSAPVRGGIPVCWPWFGSHPNGSEWPQQGLGAATRMAPAGCLRRRKQGGGELATGPGELARAPRCAPWPAPGAGAVQLP
ncbi:hypothetical protein P4233_28880 [Pseudomonas aeruginosa]|nr:hypothetical protein [Pseudomonas aeruginosa]